MKSKIKKFINSKLFIFIITALVFSTIGVSAATYFESSSVTYDNSESGLTSTDVQGAIDELYNECFPPTPPAPEGPGNQILETVKVVTSGDGLYEDEYEEGKYTYKGANPNNYITFNNETAGWRIISINSDKTIKIMRITSIVENTNWDKEQYNNWARPATINTYLNEEYYSSLNTTAQNQIAEANYSIGAVTPDNNNLTNQINDENSKQWKGKIVLPTASEYIRSSSNNNCGSMSKIWGYSSNTSNTCVNTNWMQKNNINDINSDWWTITPEVDTTYSVFYIGRTGYMDTNNTMMAYLQIHPVITISSEVKITGGNGTLYDPYRIE